MDSPTTQLQILRITPSSAVEATDTVATEEPLEIRLVRPAAHPESIAITMRTPGHDAPLAAGFLWTEGIIKNPADIHHIEPPRLTLAGQPPNTIDVHLTASENPLAPTARRNFYVSSSCGVCGKASINALHIARPAFASPPTLQIQSATISSLPETLRHSQQVFDRTGGLHAAALFSPTGELLLLREDVGRHNALDKIIGTLLLENRLPADNALLLLSGRASFELVQKAAMAGIQLIAAVGAPSSLAISTAHAFNITLLGFLRDSRFNIYTHSERILL